MYINDGRISYSSNQKKQLLQALYAIEETPSVLSGPEDAVVQFLKYRNRRKEYFVTLSMDSKNHVIKRHTISQGTVDQAVIFPQEVLRATLLCHGSGIILGHNHPGGDPSPSKQDISMTARIVEGGQLLGIRILDHIIVSRNGHFSFSENGLI